MMEASSPSRRRARLAPRSLLAAALAVSVSGCRPTDLPVIRLADPPADLQARAVSFPSGPDSTIHGWLARGRAGAGAVVVLHGIGASRLDMLDRARFLARMGFTVLLIDFRGHGASSGGPPTYGGLESRDARGAVELVRAEIPHERVGVIGISMGGAAALVGPTPLAVDALVLESVYPTIADAVRHRARAWFGPLGRIAAPLAMRLLFPRQGIAAADLRPIDRIGAQRAPTFVIAGTEDPYTPLAESKALFDRAASEKSFWAVPGAAHVDLHAFAGIDYERHVGAFLSRHLRSAPPQPEQEPERADRRDPGAQRQGDAEGAEPERGELRRDPGAPAHDRGGEDDDDEVVEHVEGVDGLARALEGGGAAREVPARAAEQTDEPAARRGGVAAPEQDPGG
jgi:pimeloyl-ACP methyl ester carboxylesterase